MKAYDKWQAAEKLASDLAEKVQGAGRNRDMMSLSERAAHARDVEVKMSTKNWHAVSSEAHKNNPESIRVDIVQDDGPFGPAFVAGDIMPDDAALMCAAPELLAALVAFRDGGTQGGQNFAELHGSYSPAIKLAIAAIAKAKGEQ